LKSQSPKRPRETKTRSLAAGSTGAQPARHVKGSDGIVSNAIGLAPGHVYNDDLEGNFL